MNHKVEDAEIERVRLGNSAELSQAIATYNTLFKGGSKAQATIGVFLDTR